MLELTVSRVALYDRYCFVPNKKPYRFDRVGTFKMIGFNVYAPPAMFPKPCRFLVL